MIKVYSIRQITKINDYELDQTVEVLSDGFYGKTVIDCVLSEHLSEMNPTWDNNALYLIHEEMMTDSASEEWMLQFIEDATMTRMDFTE